MPLFQVSRPGVYSILKIDFAKPSSKKIKYQSPKQIVVLFILIYSIFK